LTILKLSSRRGNISAITAGAVTLVLVAGVFLAGCTGLKSSAPMVVAQGLANEIPVKPHSAESAILSDLHGTVEVKTGDGQWTLAQPGQTLKSGQNIRTGSVSNVTVVFYDSSRMGEKVRVSGMVSADGIWVAEKIERIDTEHETSFAFYGPVLSVNPWNVGGVSLAIDEHTTIKGEIMTGEMVKVTGWILESGTWLATEIKHTGLHLGQGCFMVGSVVQSITGDQIILIDGQTLKRTGDLEVTGDLKEGSLVRYQYCVDKDGVGKIGRIIVVYQLEELPPATGKVVICHYPHGNLGNRHTIEVAQPAVSTHMAHGDTLGPCPSEKLDKKPKKDK
jgi:hypothetical protein